MRIHPIIPIYLIAPLAIIAIALLIVCLVKKKLRIKRNLRRIAMLILLCLVLIRPVFIDGKARNETNNLNVFFVVDATYSMVTRDVEGQARYRKVAKDIYDISKALIGSKFSVIIEDNSIYTAIPLSTSTDFVSSIWNENTMNANGGKGLVQPKKIDYSTSTDLNELLSAASDKITDYEKKNPSRNNYIIFMSDGEDFSEGIGKQVALRNVLDGGAVLGYGSINGSKISMGGTSYVHYEGNDSTINVGSCDSSNEYASKTCVISAINEDNLKKIANELKINYYHREGGDVPSAVIDDIKAQEQFSTESEVSNSYVDIYWVFSMILLGLLLWDFREVLDNVMREREYKNA